MIMAGCVCATLEKATYNGIQKKAACAKCNLTSRERARKIDAENAFKRSFSFLAESWSHSRSVDRSWGEQKQAKVVNFFSLIRCIVEWVCRLMLTNVNQRREKKQLPLNGKQRNQEVRKRAGARGRTKSMLGFSFAYIWQPVIAFLL